MLKRFQQDPSWLLTLPTTALCWLVFEFEGWSAFGLSLSIYYTYILVRNMGNTIPVIDLMTVIASLQWIVGPLIDYHNDLTHYKYHMYVDELTYMSYIVPAVLAFRIGTLYFYDYLNLDEIGKRVTLLLNNHPKMPYLLILVGFLAPYFGSVLPSTVQFVFSLLANLKYIGVIYLLFSENSNRWPIFMIILGITTTASIVSGMFHDLLLWAMLLFTFVARELNMRLSVKIVSVLLGIFLVITIQTVKHEYRSLTWGRNYTGNKSALFISLSINQWRTGSIVTPTSDQDINVRLNQGWIISSIMNHVPEKEPYAQGSTITEAIEASLLPRFLAPNKKKAGGQENFRKYTGLLLGEGTSMSISIAGEGYANFGHYGGIIFMFFWGLFISWFWKKLQDWSDFYPTLLVWSPILFIQVVKAETELVVVLNHLIKASVLILGLLWLIKNQKGIRI